jgi:ubiquinone/menaquinone biosynthesis C-methylase UbiE
VSLERHKQDWERLAEADAMGAVLTSPEDKGRAWNADRFFATGEAEIAHVLTVADGLQPVARGRALDFGCGVGRLTRALGKRYQTAVGVDIAEAMIAQARQLNEAFPHCEFLVNNAPDLHRFETDSFDFVYSNIVLQHLPSVAEIERYVAEFLRIAKPEGLVVFAIPAHVAFPYSLQPRRRLYGILRRLGVSEEWMLRRTPLTPMRMTVVREAEVRKLLAAHGATVLEAESIEDGPVRTVRYYVAPTAR